MKQGVFRTLWSFVSILSLDVVSGALAGMYFFQAVWELSLSWELYFLLGLAVWVVYTGDHLLDAQKEASAAFSKRHEFHRRYQKPILLGLIAALVLGAWVLAISPQVYFILPYGVGLGILIVCWYALLTFRHRHVAQLKELVTAFFYTSGIALAPGVLAMEEIRFVHCLLLTGYFLLAFINLLMLSYSDRRYDQLHSFASISLRIPAEVHKKLCLGLLYAVMGGAVLSIFLVFSFYKLFFGILLLIAVVHYKQMNRLDEHARPWMEISFSIPWLLLLF